MSAVPEGLLLDVQRQLERRYALDHADPVTRFLIDADQAGDLPGDGSRTLLRHDDEGVRLGVVLAPSVAAKLAERDPRVRLDRDNLGPLCTLTEEVSHFVYLLFCARVARTVTELELELQAELDKYLTAMFLLSIQNDGAFSTRLRDLLFRHYRLDSHVAPEQAERYRAASDMAYRYCGYLERSFLRRDRLADLAREMRRFYRLGQRDKLERIAALQ